jgi:hypothetical protein
VGVPHRGTGRARLRACAAGQGIPHRLHQFLTTGGKVVQLLKEIDPQIMRVAVTIRRLRLTPDCTPRRRARADIRPSDAFHRMIVPAQRYDRAAPLPSPCLAQGDFTSTRHPIQRQWLSSDKLPPRSADVFSEQRRLRSWACPAGQRRLAPMKPHHRRPELMLSRRVRGKASR